MKDHKPGAVTPQFIAGVNLPLVEAEPEVVVAFHKYYADAIRDAETAVDETDEIEELVTKGRALLGSLEH
jgi:ABC-type nitrate/sulfonate/bicarbonate transport system substrate-binding protein